MVWNDDISLAHQFVLADGGNSIKTLVLGENMFDSEEHGGKMVDDFLKYCPNVTKLRIYDESCSWIKRFGGKVKVLGITTGEEGHGNIQHHCTGLRELVVDDSRVISLGSDNTSKLWMNSCFTLGTLLIQFRLPVESISNIQETCRGLKRVKIWGDSRAASQLIASYDDQLEWAYLHCFNEDEIQHVAIACKNARFYLYYPQNEALIPALNLLENQLETIETCLMNHTNNLNMDQLSAAWSKCVNLRELNLNGYTFQDIPAIFATPHEHLESIRLEWSRGNILTDVPFYSVAQKSCNTLKSLFLNFRLACQDITRIQATCRGLKRIGIRGKPHAVSKLIASYGNQLEWANLNGFNKDGIARVAMACMNARFALIYPENGELVSSLNMLGDRLEVVSDNPSRHRRNSDDMERFCAAWKKCVNLRKLKLMCPTFQDLQAVIETPKKNLKVISIYLAPGATEVDKNEMRQLIIAGCKNAETIDL